MRRYVWAALICGALCGASWTPGGDQVMLSVAVISPAPGLRLGNAACVTLADGAHLMAEVDGEPQSIFVAIEGYPKGVRVTVAAKSVK